MIGWGIVALAALVLVGLIFAGMRASDNRRVAEAAAHQRTLELELLAAGIAPPPPGWVEDPMERVEDELADLQGENDVLRAKISRLEAEAERKRAEERLMYEASRKEGYKKPLKFPPGWGK